MACADFQYPPDHANEDLVTICSALPTLPACSLTTQCSKNPAYFPATNYCDSWKLLTTACLDPAGKNEEGCASYSKFCGKGTRIKSCGEEPVEDGRLEYAKLQSYYTGSCNSMPNMQSCTLCPAYSTTPSTSLLLCDVLADWSAGCREMPGMAACADWKTMCTTTPKSPYCTGVFSGGESSTNTGGSSNSNSNSGPTVDPDALSAPPMLAYFHATITDYFLFKSWLPKTGWQYALSLVAVFFMAFSNEGIQLLRALDEQRFELEPLPLSPSYSLPQFSRDLTRFLLALIASGWSYLIMLLVMSFNVGVFLAAIFGFGCGAVLWGYVRRNALGSSWSGRGLQVEPSTGKECM